MIIGGTALTGVALACAVFVCANPFAPSVSPMMAYTAPVAAQPKAMVAEAPASGEPPATIAAKPSPAIAQAELSADAAAAPGDPAVTIAMLDPAFSRGARPSAFSTTPPDQLNDQFTTASLPPAAAPPKPETPATQEAVRQQPPAARRPVQTASLPSSTPPRIPQAPKPSREETQAAKVRAAAEKIFEKVLGKKETPEPAPQLALAYASPDGGIPARSSMPNMSAQFDAYTAVYDISSATVYMPDGTKLEAHSGYGNVMDDPRHVHVKMRGATPPHVYDLKLREALFHGVRAIRMTPVGGERAIFGRTGILAHSYLLGPKGASHGCVSFKNYNAFLQAYLSGQVKRMVVVASVD